VSVPGRRPILVEHGFDSVKQQKFYRAIGGGIEFGEPAIAAVRREWMEELGAELDDLQLLVVVENLFTFEGKPGHELVFVFTGRLRDADRYTTGPLAITESDGKRHSVDWIPIAELVAGTVPQYPAGVLELYWQRHALPRE
jgi:8-oxo-dGTP pyrophosphatase MutT (NUDIX family)